MLHGTERTVRKLAVAALLLALGATPALADPTDIEWQSLIGGDDTDSARSGQQTADGGYILLGSSWSSESGDVSGENHGMADYWVVRLDGTGAIAWERLLGGTGDDRGICVQQTDDGGFILLGRSNSSASGDVTGTNRGERDLWVVKTNKDGVIEWQRLFGGSGDDRGVSVQQTDDGGYVLLGDSTSSYSGDVQDQNNGFSDYWVVKLAGNGEIEWQRLLGGDDTDDVWNGGYEVAQSIRQTADGGYIVSGQSSSSNNGDVEDKNSGSYDIWVVKLDPDGKIEWQNLLGGVIDEYGNSIQQTADGNYALLGHSTSSWSGDVLNKNAGLADFWFMTLHSTGYVMNQRLLGGNGYDWGESARQTSDGGFILVGDSESSASGDVSGTNHGEYDLWVVKLSDYGNVVWQRMIGGSEDEWAGTVQQTADGGFVIFGYSLSSASGDLTRTNHGKADAWVVKLLGAKPEAGFDMDPSSGEVPLRVDFWDVSRYANSWEYDFGDGTGSAAQNPPSHVFYGGEYAVVQTVKNVAGDDSAVQTVSAWSPLPGRVEAENFDGDADGWYDTTDGNSGGVYRETDVDIEVGGSNYDVGWVREGEYLRYAVDVDGDRDYTFTVRACAWEPARTIEIHVDGLLRATVTTPQTGSPAVFADVSTVIPLTTSSSEVKLVFRGGSQNIDYFTVTPLGVIVTPTPTETPAPPGVVAVPPSTLLPTDMDDDGLCEDVNGNGRADFADVVLFFNQMTWIAANEPLEAFDYNANGRIDFADVVWLFNNL